VSCGDTDNTHGKTQVHFNGTWAGSMQRASSTCQSSADALTVSYQISAFGKQVTAVDATERTFIGQVTNNVSFIAELSNEDKSIASANRAGIKFEQINETQANVAFSQSISDDGVHGCSQSYFGLVERIE
jgi:hypothetical protein